MRRLMIAAGVGLTLLLAGCSSAADVSSRNLSTDADNFKILRRITFTNAITDKILFTMEGRCSILDQGGQLEVTCKVGPDKYKKNFFGKSDNTPYIVEQLEDAGVSEYRYKFTFAPSTLIPDIEVR